MEFTHGDIIAKNGEDGGGLGVGSWLQPADAPRGLSSMASQLAAFSPFQSSSG